MNVALIVFSGLAGAGAGWLMNFGTEGGKGLPSTRAASVPSNSSFRNLQSLISGLLLALLALKLGTPSVLLFVYGGLFLVLVWIAIFDFRRLEIPNAVTVPGTLIGLALGTFVLPLGFRESVLGLLVGGGVLLAATLIETIRKKDIGGGDWKYAAMIGTFIGPRRMAAALVLTGIFGFFGAAALAFSQARSASAIERSLKARRPQALGPWLSIGAVASILLG